ncbi:outer membrane protein with beta-barrel domain [Capnocytophaga leadbetteri]|uniref:Outer membrane protein with beta-barrel domain n=1 Tax=Capnocytophaga leadbetteri TaxID=327575 RepID=A0A2T5XSP7_9FLAO|nr:porin family protein [Capnocytophaga leadbetteri]PTX03614.1 outer membrane protein with beta-barrel domain [Capnocytophaga leadbetteri]
MKRIITTVAVAIATIGAVSAQEIKFGAKAGLNLSTVSISEQSMTRAGFTTTTKQTTGFRPSFHIGAFAEYGFTDKLFVEAGIAYSSQGATLEKTESKTINNATKVVVDERTTESKDTSLILNFLNVPIWLKYDIAGFRPKVGVNLGYLANVKSKVGSQTEKLEANKRFDFGVGVGAEYNLPMGLFVDADFVLGLGNMADKDIDTTVKNRAIQIGVDYKF